MPGLKVMEFDSKDKNPGYKNVNSSSVIYIDKQIKVLPDKNPGYKNVNSSSVTYIEPPKKVLPDKNPGYKNVNSSSVTYIEKPVNIIKQPEEQSSMPSSYRYCSII